MFLHRGGKPEDVLDELVVEKRNSHFQRHSHAHLVRVAQQHSAHVAIQFRPTDPREIVGQRDRHVERLSGQRQTGAPDRFIGKEAAAPGSEFDCVSGGGNIREAVAKIAGQTHNPAQESWQRREQLQPRNIAETRIAAKQFIAAQSGQRDFHASGRDGARHDVSVDRID